MQDKELAGKHQIRHLPRVRGRPIATNRRVEVEQVATSYVAALLHGTTSSDSSRRARKEKLFKFGEVEKEPQQRI